ncbi:hypothetical protein ACWGDE_07665 [Streptomyces sp. NPDC054956]
MPTEKSPAELAGAAAEAVRQLNRLTLNTKTLSAPEISNAVQSLLQLVDRLPQALDQLGDHLVREQRAGRVRMEDGRDSSMPALKAESHLSDAGSELDDVHGHLRKAGALLAAMGTPLPTDNKETTE